MEDCKEPEWVSEKASLDAMDDGDGPYLEWLLDDEKEKKDKQKLWKDFVKWAEWHFGQGYSLACSEGSLLEKVTAWAFKAYMAGRKEKRNP